MKRSWSEVEEYGELGIIESINLRNFMCHENLSFDFDPHLNFIIGRNGSGKSAILTAIILALGGKSGTTGRYSNIKGFIKTGKNSASIAITLKNCGPDAYKQNEFGNKIIVERHFTSDGISSYKLKSETGRIVSTSKEELINILNVMDIKVDNPSTVLTQETSRNFLVSKNSRPQRLFELFYKGTGLEKLNEYYRQSIKQTNEAKAELEKKESVIPEMEKDIKKVKAVLEKSTLIPELKKELLWAIVIELEKKKSETEQAFKNVNAQYLEMKRKLERYEAEVNKNTEYIAEAQTKKKEAQDNMTSWRVNLQELAKKKGTLSSELRELQGALSSNERSVKKLTAEVLALEKIADDIRLKNERDLIEDKLRHERALYNLNNEIKNITSQLEIHVCEKEKLSENISSLQREVITCNAKIQEMNYEKSKFQQEKQQLTDGLANRVKLFGTEMANVLRDIDRAAQAGRFREKPKGPIGLYINVKQSEWIFAIQECLKIGLLRTFVCSNDSDAELLTEILKKYYRRNHPSIITTKFESQVYNVARFKTVCPYPTVLDMLEIEDPVITNCLIDQARIENILLIADPNKALKLMLYSPPQHCEFAYTPNGDQYRHSPFRNYSCRRMNQVCMLKKVNEDDIRIKNEQLKELSKALLDKQLNLKRLNEQISLNEQEVRCKDNEILQLRIRLKQKQMQLNEEENSYEEPKNIDGLNSDLDLAKKVKQKHEELLAKCQEQIKIITREIDSLENSANDLTRNLQVEQRKYYTISEKCVQYENSKEKYEMAINKLKDQFKDLEPLYKKYQAEFDNESATVQQATTQATAVSPRINTERSPDCIREIIKETEKFINQQKNCDRQALTNEYNEKVENYNKAKKELQRQEKIQSRLENMLTSRNEKFMDICKSTSVCLTCNFSTLLSENKFSGYPRVDFDKKTLDIAAKPIKMNSQSKDKHSLTQLSGGERSFVTIAFLLSLWERIRMPFRALDEYDVFMDSNNRHRSFNLLINTTRANKKVQYIFLSPLELPQLENSVNIKIHKMPAPRK